MLTRHVISEVILLRAEKSPWLEFIYTTIAPVAKNKYYIYSTWLTAYAL